MKNDSLFVDLKKHYNKSSNMEDIFGSSKKANIDSKNNKNTLERLKSADSKGNKCSQDYNIISNKGPAQIKVIKVRTQITNSSNPIANNPIDISKTFKPRKFNNSTIFSEPDLPKTPQISEYNSVKDNIRELFNSKSNIYGSKADYKLELSKDNTKKITNLVNSFSQGKIHVEELKNGLKNNGVDTNSVEVRFF